MVKIEDFNSFKELNDYLKYIIAMKKDYNKFLKNEKSKINRFYEKQKEHEYMNFLLCNPSLSKIDMQRRINRLTTDNDYSQYVFDLSNKDLYADDESLSYDINAIGSMLSDINNLRTKTNGEWTCILHEILGCKYYLKFYKLDDNNIFVFYVMRGTNIDNISINELINREKSGSVLFYERLSSMPQSMNEYFSRKKTLGIIPRINDQINELLFNEYKNIKLTNNKKLKK